MKRHWIALGCLLAARTLAAQPLPVPVFEAQTIATIGKGYGMCLADVDGDGKLDILLADVWDFVWYRNGDWKRFVLARRVDKQHAMSIDACDADGDGKVDIAICTQGKAASIYYLRRPADPTQPWEPIKLPSEPEQHRIRWVRDSTGEARLIAVPIQGRRNHLHEPGLERDDNIKVYSYRYTLSPDRDLQQTLLLDAMRDMHAFGVIPSRSGHGGDRLAFVGIEGVERMGNSPTQPWRPDGAHPFLGMTPPVLRADGSLHAGVGEIDEGHTRERTFLATIEPKHGTQLAVYPVDAAGRVETGRLLLDATLDSGHALHCGDLLGLGRDQIVAGWWGQADKKNRGIRLYVPLDETATHWQPYTIDDGQMACQSLQIADLDGDGRPDIVAAGWDSNNLIIYWNRMPLAPATTVAEPPGRQGK